MLYSGSTFLKTMLEAARAAAVSPARSEPTIEWKIYYAFPSNNMCLYFSVYFLNKCYIDLLTYRTRMLCINFVGWSAHVHLLGSPPIHLIGCKIAHLSIQYVLAYVTFDEVIGSPFDSFVDFVQLIGGDISFRPTDHSPGQNCRRKSHCEAEFYKVSSWTKRTTMINFAKEKFI